ncbi:MAG: Crp/Fnr family transcriptional regulator [Aureispira sp.]
MMDKEKALQQWRAKIHKYAPISEKTWQTLVALMRWQVVKKGTILLRHGQIARDLHFIAQGALRAYFTDAAGNYYNKNIFLDKDLACSTVSLLRSTPSNFTIECLEESYLLNVTYFDYRQLIEHCSDFKNYYIKYLEQHWIVEKEEREVALVMENATERYLKLLQKHPRIDQRIALHHLSSHLGITPTQLSRIRKKIQ